MSIIKRIVSALAAVAVVSTSLVATTIFAAEAPTVTAEVITGDALIAEDDGAEAYDIGLKVSFTGFTKDIKAIAFNLKMPSDIQAQNKKGLGVDMTAANLKNYSLYYNNSAFDDGWGNTTLANDIGEGWTRGYISWLNWADGGSAVYFDSADDNYFVISLRVPSEDYVLPEGSFAMSDVEVVYWDENSPLADVVVVDPTTAGGDDPAPIDPVDPDAVLGDDTAVDTDDDAKTKTWTVTVGKNIVGKALKATLTNDKYEVGTPQRTQTVDLTFDSSISGDASLAFDVIVHFYNAASAARTTLDIALAE